MRKAKWPGNWKFACHVCGFWFPSEDIVKRWDGLYVCHKDYEERHPQTLIKVRGESAVPAFVNKDPNPDDFVAYCTMWTSSSYADYGTADCMQADYAPPFDAMVSALATSAIAGVAISGSSISGLNNGYV